MGCCADGKKNATKKGWVCIECKQAAGGVENERKEKGVPECWDGGFVVGVVGMVGMVGWLVGWLRGMRKKSADLRRRGWFGHEDRR